MVTLQIMDNDDELAAALKPREKALLLDTKVSRAFVAALVATSRKNISILERDGRLHPNPDGTYNLHRFVLDWSEYLKTRVSNDRADAQAKLTALRIREAELRLAKQCGELWDAEEMMEYSIELVGAMNQRVQSAPSHLSRDPAERARLEEGLYKHIVEPTNKQLEQEMRKLEELKHKKRKDAA
jgi:hypothetical protein